jgi:hypothetical protein
VAPLPNRRPSRILMALIKAKGRLLPKFINPIPIG